MASGCLIPKAPCASFILLTGSVVISRPSYPVACRPRGVSGIDSTAGEVLCEASTSRHHPGRRSGHEAHMSRCLQKVSSLRAQTGRALPPCLAISKTFSTRSRAWQGGAATPWPSSWCRRARTRSPAIESWASAPEGPLPAALLVVSRPGGRHGQGVGWPGGAARLLAHAARGDIQP